MSEQTETATPQTEDSPAQTRILSGEPFTVAALAEELGIEKKAIWSALTKLRGEGQIFQERPSGYKNAKEFRYVGKGEPKAKAAPKPRSRPRKAAAAPTPTAPSTPRRQGSLPMPGDTISGQVMALRLAADKSLEAVLSVGREQWVLKLVDQSS